MNTGVENAKYLGTVHSEIQITRIKKVGKLVVLKLKSNSLNESQQRVQGMRRRATLYLLTFISHKNYFQLKSMQESVH